MFETIAQRDGKRVEIAVDGRAITATEGENLAAALLRAGFATLRSTPVSGAPRGPYCMMGVCFECLAIIDGVPNRQACLETVRAGMSVERQDGAPAHISAAAKAAP